MTVSKRLRFEIFKRDNHTCRYCGESAPDVKLTVDHVVPTALGGSDEPSNLVTACAGCNAGKSSVSPTDPVVDDVKQDARRWAEAMKSAAAIRSNQMSEVERICHAFDVAWNDWYYTSSGQQKQYSRSDNWRQSIEQFVGAGLDEEAILLKIEPAMTKEWCRDRWRFFCGCCWKEVQKRQEIASAMLALSEDAP